MTTIRDAWMKGAEHLAMAGIESARLDARVLLAHVMNLEPGASLSAREPSPEEMARYAELLERRVAREPVAYIIGEREFWSLTFAVGPGVLVPRPETETLIEQAERDFRDRAEPLDVLDLGAGSGCLLIAFLHDFPAARGTGIDRSSEALVWARRNAETLSVTGRATWREEDWSSVQGTYDVIFSNPPYLAEWERTGLRAELAREPEGALFAGPDGADSYRSLAPLLVRALKPAGRAYLEIGAGQAEVVSSILAAAGLEILSVGPDLSGIPRCVTVRLSTSESRPCAEKTVGKPGSNR